MWQFINYLPGQMWKWNLLQRWGRDRSIIYDDQLIGLYAIKWIWRELFRFKYKKDIRGKIEVYHAIKLTNIQARVNLKHNQLLRLATHFTLVYTPTKKISL